MTVWAHVTSAAPRTYRSNEEGLVSYLVSANHAHTLDEALECPRSSGITRSSTTGRDKPHWLSRLARRRGAAYLCEAHGGHLQLTGKARRRGVLGVTIARWEARSDVEPVATHIDRPSKATTLAASCALVSQRLAQECFSASRRGQRFAIQTETNRRPPPVPCSPAARLRSVSHAGLPAARRGHGANQRRHAASSGPVARPSVAGPRRRAVAWLRRPRRAPIEVVMVVVDDDDEVAYPSAGDGVKQRRRQFENRPNSLDPSALARSRARARSHCRGGMGALCWALADGRARDGERARGPLLLRAREPAQGLLRAGSRGRAPHAAARRSMHPHLSRQLVYIGMATRAKIVYTRCTGSAGRGLFDLLVHRPEQVAQLHGQLHLPHDETAHVLHLWLAAVQIAERVLPSLDVLACLRKATATQRAAAVRSTTRTSQAVKPRLRGAKTGGALTLRYVRMCSAA
eukprot:scaffold269_cov404-Prasinococcus_capsulatus_cf.AAC.45